MASMFKRARRETYTLPISFDDPIDDGKFEKLTFKFLVHRKSKSEMAELTKRGLTYDDMMRELVAGWHEVKDPDGAPVEFSRTALDDWIDTFIPGARVFCETYMAGYSGQREKN